MKYYFSKAEFLKRAPECVKNEEKEHVDIWDGIKVLFLTGDRTGYLPLYHYPGEAYYPGIYKNYCDREEGEPFLFNHFGEFTCPDPWPQKKAA